MDQARRERVASTDRVDEVLTALPEERRVADNDEQIAPRSDDES
ncbi:MAG: hypothetical protein WD576_00050 [Nitriliruptoraceae bacterium]